MKFALISVSDKSGVAELAAALQNSGYTILSTGGTALLLREKGIEVTDVSAHTGFPEIMDGRVKTLHPKIHAGILSRREEDSAVMDAHDITAIDIVAVNLYPFRQTIAKTDVTLATAIENIDIGGPSMIRSAAKNHKYVSVLTDPADYARVVSLCENGKAISHEFRYELACKAFAHTAAYDSAIAGYLQQRVAEPHFPQELTLDFSKLQELRYGENPHQTAAVYRQYDASPSSIAAAEQHHGKELSYNNLADADAALECVKQFDEPACVIVKHANPCGVACAADLASAYELAYRCDPESAFGGIIALNSALDVETMTRILQQQFVEVIIAPSFAPEVLPLLAEKPSIRLLTYQPVSALPAARELKKISGGLLVQDADQAVINAGDLEIVGNVKPDIKTIADLVFAWKIVKFVKSNAIVYCKDQSSYGIGAGQMSRVNSARIAAIKAEDAGLDLNGAVMASDAFFPFRDSIDTAAERGISAIVQPGGSVRDQEVIDAANEHGIAMAFTGVRHFRH